MKNLVEATADEAKAYFLKNSSYFNSDLPSYINFKQILDDISGTLDGKLYSDFKKSDPSKYNGVNYCLLTNKDGNFAWRQLELIHPVIYVSLVNLICSPKNWCALTERIKSFEQAKPQTLVCCSLPVMSVSRQSDKATQVQKWWENFEQQSLTQSLEFSHVLHTDVTDCYGSLYTHSIAWAIHGFEKAKANKGKHSLLGNKIDHHIQACRYGQTNGIPQGSVLMDFVAELVLGYVDKCITTELKRQTGFRILRYRDDYRIFSNSDRKAEEILKVISNKLRHVGMKLGVSKTFMSPNVIEGSIKPDKLAGINLQDLGCANAKTMQKQLLRLHVFGRRFPNSGTLCRLVVEFYEKIVNYNVSIEDLKVQVAIATDIAVVSPRTFPIIAGIISYFISRAKKNIKKELWTSVAAKMHTIPYNGYLDIWLQRVITKPQIVNVELNSKEHICKIVNGEMPNLWENSWVTNKDLLSALAVSRILVPDAVRPKEVVEPEEVKLFVEKALAY
jgi:hypothetical protein